MLGDILLLTVIFGIALFIWAVRTLIETDPDPFFLYLTFFAFAGQCTRTAEVFRTEDTTRLHGVLFLIGLGVIMSQVFVMRGHRMLTSAHYKELLTHSNTDHLENEVDRWVAVLLRITRVDLYPGGYKWLPAFVFKTEPREQSRKDAVWVLPGERFQKSETGLTPASLEVPESGDRRRLWSLYVGLAVVAWLCFAGAVLISPSESSRIREQSSNTSDSRPSSHGLGVSDSAPLPSPQR